MQIIPGVRIHFACLPTFLLGKSACMHRVTGIIVHEHTHARTPICMQPACMFEWMTRDKNNSGFKKLHRTGEFH